jgi:hypothetical protein
MLPVLAATRELLAALDPLPYPQRMRQLVAWARSAPDRVEICADLRGQDAYQRQLALVAAVVVRDRAGVDAASRDPQPSIRATALGALLRADGLTPDRLDASARERRRIYRALRRLAAPATADALIGEIRARYGDAEAAAVLPACGPETVRALLPDLAYALDPDRLVGRHAGPLLDHVEGRLAESGPQIRDQIWHRAAAAVLRADPDRALDLLERYAPRARLPGDLTAYGLLAAHDPGRVLRLLVAPDRAPWLRRTSLPPALRRRLARLPTDDLVPLAQLFPRDGRAFAALLGEVPPNRRGDLYDRALAEVDTAGYVPDEAVMEVLPAAVRIREATRVLGLARTREHESSVLRWSSYLAWPDASAALAAALRAGDAERRGQAYALLVAAARRSRDARTVAEVVGWLSRLRNEQDPVRAAALTALAGVARLLTPQAAAGLTRLRTDAVEARDASAATMAALSNLAADTLRHHVDVPELRDWALLTIDLVATGARTPLLRRFDLALRRGQETMVFDRLRGWVGQAAAQGRYGPLLALTRALGRRARHLPELQDLLRRATGPDAVTPVAAQAIRLWLDDPRGRGERVAELLTADASTVAVAPVWQTICATRTDLLDLVLNRPVRGRFVSGGQGWVPGWPAYPGRWLPRQQAAYAAAQERIVSDGRAGPGRRTAAIRAAARIPGPGRELVLRHLDSPEVVIAEAALGALVWTDRPDAALPVLLGYADGDRARVAMYAAGRAARHVRPAELAAPLTEVLTAQVKVTSRKEAARLLARYGPPEVMDTLLAVHQAADTHRDVRAAIVSAARQRLDAEPSWTILAAAGQGSREERLTVLDAAPFLVAERHRPRYAALVLAACAAGDREVRRTAFTQLPGWSRWTTGATDLVVDRLTDPGEEGAALAIGSLLETLGHALLRAVLDRLVARAADDRPGDATVDQPARRRVDEIASAVSSWSRSGPVEVDRSTLVATARWLADQPDFAGAGTSMLVGLGRLDDLDEIADRCAGRPVLAVRTAERIRSRHTELLGAIDPGAVRGIAGRLAGRGDLAGGLFALALLDRASHDGWAPPWRELLHGLRRHPDPDVRAEAYAVDMASAVTGSVRIPAR